MDLREHIKKSLFLKQFQILLLINYVELINKSLKTYLKASDYQFEVGVQEFIKRGGKRLRPVICLLTCEAFNGDINKALPTACALEFLHSGSLVIDDIQDKSLMRRGEKTLHTKYGLASALNMFARLWNLRDEALLNNL